MQKEEIKLSTQAIATLMVTLQKCLLEQTDITELLRDYNFNLSEQNELTVINPPSRLSIDTSGGKDLDL